ncbi:MAG: ATP-grasp domain-containing protein [Bacteroidetes bacterium]|nr:ATP-grasp domain-containing protein [Bacteroidota bacterium]
MKKLAVIGASYLQLPLVQKAKEMGLEVHCFAWEDGAICKNISDYFYAISIVNKEEILEVCKQIGIDGITSIASDLAVQTVCFVAERLELNSNTYKSAIVSTNKFLMREKFLLNDVVSPRFALSWDAKKIDTLKFPVIVKPTDRSGSRGVLKVNDVKDIEDAVVKAKKESFSNEAIIEEFVSGDEVSVETISWNGKHYILTITDKVTTGYPYFVELEHHQPSLLSLEIQEKIKSATIEAIKALNIQYGATHSEFKITVDKQVFAIEVGARMGGDFIGSNLVQLSTGYDFLEGVVNVALGKFLKPNINKLKYAGIYFLCKETEFIKKIIQSRANDKKIVIAEITDNKLHSVKCSADRSGYFIYQSEKKFKI